LRIISDVAEELNLDLVWGVEAIGGAIRLIQGTESIGSHTMKVEVVTVTRRTGPRGSTPVPTAGAIVPIVFVQPSVPPLMHEVAGPGGGVGICPGRVVEGAVGGKLVGTKKIAIETAKATGVILDVVIQAGVKVASGCLTEGAVIDRAMPRAAVCVLQPVGDEVRGIPVFGKFEIYVAGVVPAAVVPVRLPLVVGPV
jgi:hypothetical protein